MFFKNSKNEQVELRVLGYEFPNNTEGGDWNWDANWLNIYLKVESSLGNWQVVDPCLTTWDLEMLAQWFSDLSNSTADINKQEFLEPNLAWEAIVNNTSESIIRMYFDLECRPSNAMDSEIFIDFTFSNFDLEQLSNAILEEYNRFPKR